MLIVYKHIELQDNFDLESSWLNTKRIKHYLSHSKVFIPWSIFSGGSGIVKKEQLGMWKSSVGKLSRIIRWGVFRTLSSIFLTNQSC